MATASDIDEPANGTRLRRPPTIRSSPSRAQSNPTRASTDRGASNPKPTGTTMQADEPTKTESTTTSILIVLDPDDPDTTLQAVVQDADANAAEIHVMRVFPTAEYEQRRRDRIDAGVPGPYTIEQLTNEARRIARRVGREYLGPDGFEAMGAVGRNRDCIRRAVRTHDYDRVYVADHQHSIWQRLLGVADLSTELTRALPDVVSVVSTDDVVGPGTDESVADAVVEREAELSTRSGDT